MCKFSEANRQKLGNAVSYIAAHARYPYKTEVLKLLFLMEERMVQQAHVPFWGIPFNTWRMGPVSVDVFEELSDGPVLLDDFIALEFNAKGNKVIPKKGFCDDEFSDQEIRMMEEVVRGAVNIPERGVNAYVFAAGDQVTDTYCFPRRTYVYGEQVDDYTEEDLMALRE